MGLTSKKPATAQRIERKFSCLPFQSNHSKQMDFKATILTTHRNILLLLSKSNFEAEKIQRKEPFLIIYLYLKEGGKNCTILLVRSSSWLTISLKTYWYSLYLWFPNSNRRISRFHFAAWFLYLVSVNSKNLMLEEKIFSPGSGGDLCNWIMSWQMTVKWTSFCNPFSSSKHSAKSALF